MQQSPKLLTCVKERVKEKGSQEKLAGLVVNICSAVALGVQASDAVAPVVLEAFLADGLAERSTKVRADLHGQKHREHSPHKWNANKTLCIRPQPPETLATHPTKTCSKHYRNVARTLPTLLTWLVAGGGRSPRFVALSHGSAARNRGKLFLWMCDEFIFNVSFF